MTTQTFTRNLVVVTCSRCGITFGIPENFYENRRADGKNFFCPNDHCLCYQDSEVKKLRGRLISAENRMVAAEDQRDAAERSLRATRGVVTRFRRRVSNGVCPCCKRTFKDLARHMHTQHPDFATTQEQ
jgi:hypothetical protein